MKHLEALVSLGEFWIKYFHFLNTLPVRCTSHRIQTSTNIVMHSFTSRSGSWLFTTANLAWYPVSACTQTQLQGRNMEMLPGCKYANLPSQIVMSGLWTLQQASWPPHGWQVCLQHRVWWTSWGCECYLVCVTLNCACITNRMKYTQLGKLQNCNSEE